MRSVLSTIAMLIGAVSLDAQACSIAVDLNREMEAVAGSGIVLRGFDAEKRQSEIIKVDKIFIGDGDVENLILYRSRWVFDQYLNRHGRVSRSKKSPSKKIVISSLCPDFAHPLKEGDTYERIALVPASSATDGEANGRWVETFSSDSIVRERALETVIAKAKIRGRFKERPPKSREFGDCMECSGFPEPFDRQP